MSIPYEIHVAPHERQDAADAYGNRLTPKQTDLLRFGGEDEDTIIIRGEGNVAKLFFINASNPPGFAFDENDIEVKL